MTMSKCNVPIGYELVPNEDQLAFIAAIVSLASIGQISLREAAIEISKKVGRSVSHEFVRRKVKAHG